ncbi:MAG: glycoside hydrolase family 20 zincin-like fold domain-containing protein, partial [Bacteroidales bacterium]
MKQRLLKGVLLAAALLPLTASAGPYLLPKPHSMEITAGQSFALGRAVSVTDAFDTPFLRTALEEMGCTITEGAAATVEVKRVAVIPGTYNHSVAYMPNETYTLTVASDKITIEAVTQT